MIESLEEEEIKVWIVSFKVSWKHGAQLVMGILSCLVVFSIIINDLDTIKNSRDSMVNAQLAFLSPWIELAGKRNIPAYFMSCK